MSLVKVVVRSANKKIIEFVFKTTDEADAFISGLHVVDGWGKKDQLFDAVVEAIPTQEYLSSYQEPQRCLS